MTSICAISDIHCAWGNLVLPKADILVIAGDMTNFGHVKEVGALGRWFNHLLNKDLFRHIVYIAGNHDGLFETSRALAVDMCKPAIYLQDSGIELEGIKFWGSPWTPKFFDWYFMKDRGESIRRHWDLIPEDTRVLITHGPPHNILDQTSEGGINRPGCEDLRQVVERIKPEFHIFGHIHYSHGTLKTEYTTFINASILGERNEPNHIPIYFEI